MRNTYIVAIFIFVFLTFLAKISLAKSDTTCVADFTYEVYDVIGKPSVIQFINESTGEPTQYSWNFGDGSISNVKDPIHYFPENGNFQVELMVANNSSSDNITQNIEINVPLSVDFTFKLDSTSVVPNTFIFSGLIEGYYDQIIWNFGDHILQDVEDTIHSYSQEDKDYQVTLSAQYYFNDTSVLTRALAKGLTTSQYFNIGGQVYLEDSLMNNPVNRSDTGIAYLYRVSDEQLIPVDTNRFHNLGYYWFDTQLKAHYVIQVSLTSHSNHVEEFAPTYIGNTTSWDEAEIINLAQDKYREDVNLIFKNEKTSGLKSLYGHVNDLIEIEKEEDILICLYDTENNLIDYQINSSLSTYEFNNLGKGHYIVCADLAGVYSRPQLIYINDSKENEFKSLTNIKSKRIFPNPANSYTLISFQNNLELSNTNIQIYNSIGRLLKSEYRSLHYGNNYIHLNINDLPKGVLFIKMDVFENEVLKLVHD